MVNVVGVRFKNAGKVYYFDPAGFNIDSGDSVIVETARGLEFGTVTAGVCEVNDKDIVKPLKKVVRLADERDIKRNKENLEKSDKAMSICQEKITEHGLEMKLVDVEYTFDNNKIIFYFTADGRIDFRQLVKDLASVFKMRIELRQIGVRDEAKMMGGVGCCGRGLCCHDWMSDFHPVSIKMAKTQNLSLNPTKISGICGRLMCCLKYENDVYAELKKGMPNVGDRVKIPEGTAVVMESNILEEKIKCRIIEEEADPKNDVPEKLSSEIYTLKKGEFKRLDRKSKRRKQKEENEELSEELKQLMKD